MKGMFGAAKKIQYDRYYARKQRAAMSFTRNQNATNGKTRDMGSIEEEDGDGDSRAGRSGYGSGTEMELQTNATQ